MANEHTDFWFALMASTQDIRQRVRMWNGYLGWRLPARLKGARDPDRYKQQLIVDPPRGGWPTLTVKELARLEGLAKEFGGHPKFDRRYMEFDDHKFIGQLDLSGLILVNASFWRATFGDLVILHRTRFYGFALFDEATFEGRLLCDTALFDTPASFTGAQFTQGATFSDTQFMGGASFANVTFERPVSFDDSKFEERHFPTNATRLCLIEFQNATFMSWASFRNVLFGNTERVYSRDMWPERRVDFTGAVFKGKTDFHAASFGGAPAFFAATLHEDTDFSGIDWSTADNDHVPVEYGIRAWERLELMMSTLEKPFDRHRFFRLKMRVRRRKDGFLLNAVNWLFEKTADYGWGVGRAGACWSGHWILFAIVLCADAWAGSCCVTFGQIALASIGTSFSNAHAFFFLTASGGALEDSLRLLQENDGWGLVTGVGVTQAILGPIFLFLLLLTLRNRFRLG